MNEIIKELTLYLHTMETFDKDSAQDGQALHAYLITLTNYMARANYLMAEYKRQFKKEKANNYLLIEKDNNLSPSILRDFIDAKSADTAFVYDLAERVSRCCVHTCDGLRTIISSLKSERTFSQYQ